MHKARGWDSDGPSAKDLGVGGIGRWVQADLAITPGLDPDGRTRWQREWEFRYVDYDRASDVLYLAVEEPRPGYVEETPEGHILRFDENDEFYGVTLIGVREIMFDRIGSVTVTGVPRRFVPSTDRDRRPGPQARCLLTRVRPFGSGTLRDGT